MSRRNIMMNRKEEVYAKLKKVRTLLKEQKLEGILINSIANFAWLTAGGDSHVDIDNKEGATSLFVTHNKAFAVTTNIEAPRIETEEIAGLGFEILTFKWYNDQEEAAVFSKLTKGISFGSDTPKPGMKYVGNEFKPLRYVLMPPEIERYRWVGLHSSQAIEKAAREIEPGMTEFEIEAVMARNLLNDCMTPTVLLVAVDERNFLYRHPVPTDKKLVKYALLVCCCRRWGLVASRSRSVYFGELPAELEAKQRAVTYVDAVMMAKSRPGTLVKDVIKAAQDAYEKMGFSDEWNFQHQGGASGYDNRDYIGKPDLNEVVHLHQAFTWNPTIQGTKSEDTIIVNQKEPELITQTGNWPTIEQKVDGITLKRPAILLR
jgi:Xaa-Pro aminopeptidase